LTQPTTGRSNNRLEVDGLVLDLDGVVWVGPHAIPGSVGAISELQRRSVRLVFVTNDPRGSREDYARRLNNIGVASTADDVVTAGSALASFLEQREGAGTTAFVIGSPPLKSELRRVGLELLPPEAGRDAEIVAVGGHDGFNYAELRIATQALRGGARLYAAGRDAVFPMPDGPWPGTGSILAAVEVAGAKDAISVGKPDPIIFDIACSRLTGCRRVAIVGDNLASDVAGGSRAGLVSVLVLTGVSQRHEIPEAGVAPDFVLDDLASLLELM
jgi:glycerol 3-phosphatase-2